MKGRGWLIAFCMLLLSACTVPAPDESSPDVPFKVLAQGDDSGITLQKFLIIDTPADFNELWRIHSHGRNAPPGVDFDAHKILAIFLGQQYTGGYTVTVRKIEMLEEKTNVYVQVNSPGPGSQQSMALTQPYVFVTLPRDTGTIHYQVNKTP